MLSWLLDPVINALLCCSTRPGVAGGNADAPGLANFVSPALNEVAAVPNDSKTSVALRRRGLDDD
jgi:hypothetical protein